MRFTNAFSWNLVQNETRRFRLDYAGPTTASTSINRAIPVSSNGQQQLASQLFSPAESINRPSPVSDPRSPFTNGTETVGQQSVVVGVGKMVDQSPVKPESAVVFSRERLKKLAARYGFVSLYAREDERTDDT